MAFENLTFNPARLVRWAVAVFAAALIGTIMALTYAGVFIWNLSILTDPILDNPYATGSPFTLAQVMAIFGAFGLAAGFSDRVEQELKVTMRRVAIYHFVSSLSFCLLGLLLPGDTVCRGGNSLVLDHCGRGPCSHCGSGAFLFLGHGCLDFQHP